MESNGITNEELEKHLATPPPTHNENGERYTHGTFNRETRKWEYKTGTPPPYCVPNQGVSKSQAKRTHAPKRPMAERTDDKRTKTVTFRISPEEYEQLKDIAENEGMTVSLILQGAVAYAIFGQTDKERV